MKTGFPPALSMKSNPPRVLNAHKKDKNQELSPDPLHYGAKISIKKIVIG